MHDPTGTETPVQDHEITIPDSSLVALAIDEGEGGRYVYLADVNQNKIYLISQNDLTSRQEVLLAGTPVAMDTTENGELLVVAADGDAPSVHIINVNTLQVADSISLGAGVTPTSISVASQNRMYVGIENDDGSKEILGFSLAGDDWPAIANLSDVDGYISGRSKDRTVLYTSDQGQASGHGDVPTISKWDLTNASPELLVSGDIFGVGAGADGWVLSIPPHDDQIMVYGRGVDGQNGSVFYDGMAPVYDAGSFEKSYDLSVEYQAIAAAVTSGGARLIVAHNEELLFGTSEKHVKTRADIHIFNMETGEELKDDVIITEGFVHTNGLAIDDDRTIYALLGEDRGTANTLGVYVR